MAIFRERSGNVALIVAVLLPVLVLLGGGVIDIANIYAWRTQLQDAADAAAMAAVARNSPAYQAALSMKSDGQVTAPTATTLARSVFDLDLAKSVDNAVTGFNVDLEKAGTTVNNTITAKATYPTNFLGLIGLTNVPISVSSHAADNIPTYVDFYLLLDNSPSMGLGATPNDVSTLVAKTNCAFACHATGDSSQDYYTVAKSLGVTMRIDVVRQATQQLMTTANLTATEDGAPNEFRMAIYDLGTAAYTSPALNQVSALTSNLTKSAKNASVVDLMTVPSNNNAYTSSTNNTAVGNNDEDTDFDYTLSSLSSIMLANGSPGDGSSAKSSQKVLFFVTDGMVDMNLNGSRSMGGINQATCAALKAKGIKIAILYTTYLPSSIANDSWSQQNVAPLLPQIAPALQSCASPGLYTEVSPTQGIPEAMTALFKTIVASVRFTG